MGATNAATSAALKADRIERPLHLCAAPGLIAGHRLLMAQYPVIGGTSPSIRIGTCSQVEKPPSSPASLAAILASIRRSCPLQPIPQLRQWNRRYPRPSVPGRPVLANV